MLLGKKKYPKWRSGLLLGVLLVVALVLNSSYANAGGDDERYRTGILASLSLITKYHRAIIWAIFHLQTRQRLTYQQDWYYLMLVRKPAQPAQQSGRSDEVNEVPHARTPPSSPVPKPMFFQRQPTPPKKRALQLPPLRLQPSSVDPERTPEAYLSTDFSRMLVSPDEERRPVFPSQPASVSENYYFPQLSTPRPIPLNHPDTHRQLPQSSVDPLTLSWVHRNLAQGEIKGADVEPSLSRKRSLDAAEDEQKRQAKALKAQLKREKQRETQRGRGA